MVKKGKIQADVPKRRPSFEIAQDYMELNFKPIIDADGEEELSKKELRARRKAEKKANKQRHWVRNTIIVLVVLVMAAGATVFVWWKSSNQPVNLLDKNTRQFTVTQGRLYSQCPGVSSIYPTKWQCYSSR